MRNTLLSYLDNSEAEQFQLLERLILQSSHTLDKQGVDKVGNIICKTLSDCDLHLSTTKVADHGENLTFRSSGCSSEHRPILLVGHMDTVFPADSLFNSFTKEKDKTYGPGVIDMKGGLVSAIFLLKALQKCNLLDKIPIVLLCNSDEETGSIHSTELIRNEARRSLCAFVFECGGLNGEVVTGRKGKTGYRLDVFGKAGHAAFTGRNGKASAILELAHKTISLEKLNDPVRQIVLNVGRIEGGAAANIVAEKASAEIDCRFIKNADGAYCHETIETIVSQCTIPGTNAILTATSKRPPMEQSQRNNSLFEIVKKQGLHLSMELETEMRSGVSDANTIADCGIPVLDGLGPVGDLDHSENEYMVTNTLVSRCKLATLSVFDIWQKLQQNELNLK